MTRAIVAAAVFSACAATAAAQETKPADPGPLQLTAQQDHGLMMEALNITTLRRGAERHESQGAERRQLRRVKGQPLSEPARRARPEEWGEGDDCRGLVDQATSGDR